MLRDRHDQRGRVRGHHTGEDTGVYHEEVVHAVHPRVRVNHSSAAVEQTVVCAYLGCADPMVCATTTSGDRIGVDVVRCALTWRWRLEYDVGDLGESVQEVLDTRDDGSFVACSLEVGNVGDGHGQRAGDGRATARGGTATEVLGQSHRGIVSCAERAFDTGGPLQLAGNAVAAGDCLPEHRSNIRCRLRQDTSAAIQVGVLVGGDGVGVCSVKVVEGDVGVLDDNVGLCRG